MSEFASSQLQSYLSSKPNNLSDQKKSMNFTIPNIFSSKSKENILETSSNEKVLIDLKSALVTDYERQSLRAVETKKADIENFVPQFVDCENVSHNISAKTIDFDDYCERILLKDLKNKFKSIHINKFSMIGKIIKQKYLKKIPRLEYKTRFAEKRFKFDTLSPDDQILRHLKKA